MKLSGLILLSGLLLSLSLALAQGSHPIPPGIRQADKAEEQFEKGVPPPRRQAASPDMAKLKSDAAELAALAKSIQPDVENATKGLLAKDVIDKLKRIEKLSKRLRSELVP